MDGRIKVSFGIKTSKQGSLQRKTPAPNDDVEFISSFDGTYKSTRDVCEVGELVIPSRANTMKGPAELLSMAEDRSKGREEAAATLAQSTPLSIDQMAAQELLKDAKGVMVSGRKGVDVVPLSGDTQSDAVEASLEDYESVPVEDFGKAMLRGMGWEPGKGIGKNQRVVSPSSPQLRPKGLGLGADRTPSSASLPREQGVEQAEATLAVGCGVQVIAGSHRGLYGRVVSRNEDTGRCIVKLEIGGSCVSVNENCIKSVGKEEYASNCKVLNAAKYSRYKESSDLRLRGDGAREAEESSLSNEKRARCRSRSPRR